MPHSSMRAPAIYIHIPEFINVQATGTTLHGLLIDLSEPHTPVASSWTPTAESISPTGPTTDSAHSGGPPSPSCASSQVSPSTASRTRSRPRRHPRRRRTLEDRLEAQIRVLDDRISSARSSSVHLQKELALWKGKADNLQKKSSFRTLR